MAAAGLPVGTAAQPFVDALTELVQAQADTTGFVVLHRWAEILECHVPSELPDPDRATGAVTSRAVPLISAEDIDAAVRKTIDFRTPGA